MAESSLQDRLREHAASFDGLLSLIPAKHYYGQDNTDQWKKKKQTKEQAAAARRAKLNPDSEGAKSAKDVMDERARKRKLADIEEIEESEVEGIEREKPKQGLKIPQDKKIKKQKTASANDEPAAELKDTALTNAAHEKQMAKLERKKEKKEKKLKKLAEKGQKISEHEAILPIDEKVDVPVEEQAPDALEVIEDELPGKEMEAFEAEGLEDQPDDDMTSQNSAPPSPTFDQQSPAHPAQPSTNSSTSSTIPPARASKHIKLPTDPELLRSRLAARIEALRAARKADGPDGAPARNRQELMESRRKKEEQRRAHKKELREKAREEEDARREAALASARNSPASSILSPAIHSPEHNFSFGRVSFADGQQLASDLSRLQATPRKRGPQDAASALQASEKKRLRIAGLDDEKRADIEEKDLWLNAKKKVHGEKVRDDTNLLKKTLKRKEKMKKKSEKEWTERKEGVQKSQAMKQKKRESNLQKRRDEKGSKGKGKKANAGKKTKAKSRPGFEGSFGGKRK